MGVPVRQMLSVGWYLFKQRLYGRKKFPLVLMLEPLFQCNLECASCGKIQYPDEILKKRLTPEECFHAAEECGAPVVSIAGGEPLIHPQIVEIVNGLIARKRFVYLCTNAILLESKLHLFRPSVRLTCSVHLDGFEERHDELVCREGVFQKAVQGIRAAKQAGFRVTSNTTVFEGESSQEVRRFLDYAVELGIDGLTISPGYPYEKAPEQERFLKREKTISLFRSILQNNGLPFNHSPQYLEFLTGDRKYQCTPWGNPTRNVFGWQRPCYLLNEGYESSFESLLANTRWENYGTGRDPRCADCMAHCGYEASAVMDSLSHPREALRALLYSIGLRQKIQCREEEITDQVSSCTAQPETAVYSGKDETLLPVLNKHR